MTKQEYFNLLVETSRNGGFPSASFGDGCLYRSPEGKKCAVGLLIEDKDYRSGMEGRDVWNLMSFYDLPVPEGMTVQELSKIQKIHDRMMMKWDHDKFVELLKDVFADYQEELTFDVIV